MIERIKPKGVYEAKGYSHAVRRGNIVFIAGQVSKDVEGKLVGAGDIVAQRTFPLATPLMVPVRARIFGIRQSCGTVVAGNATARRRSRQA